MLPNQLKKVYFQLPVKPNNNNTCHFCDGLLTYTYTDVLFKKHNKNYEFTLALPYCKNCDIHFYDSIAINKFNEVNPNYTIKKYKLGKKRILDQVKSKIYTHIENNSINNVDTTNPIIGEIVKHIFFGEGKIIDVKDGLISVVFGNYNRMLFDYPKAFLTHLTPISDYIAKVIHEQYGYNQCHSCGILINSNEKLCNKCKGTEMEETLPHNKSLSSLVKIIPSFNVTENTLYVHGGTSIICTRNKHKITCVNAIIPTMYSDKTKINVNYCSDCGKFFISEERYKSYIQRYNIIYLTFEFIKEGGNYSDSISIKKADKSPLMLCGYSVSQVNNYSTTQRQLILKSILDRKILNKWQIIEP
jgi:hypothetical protein